MGYAYDSNGIRTEKTYWDPNGNQTKHTYILDGSEDFHTYYVGEQAVLVHNKCRAKNKSHPDPNASGSHTVFKRGANGEITNYATYEINVQNPSGYKLTKRFDRYGSHGTVLGPHVHLPYGKYREAYLDEMPR